MKINKQELQQAVQKLLPGTDQGTYIQGCDTIVFADKNISSYNDRIAISVPFESDLRGAVKAQEFYKILNKLSTEELEITVNESSWNIVSGNTEVDVNLCEQVIADYIENLKITEQAYKQLPANFTEGLKLCYIPGNAFYLKGILFTDTIMMSTDNIRMNFFKLDSGIDAKIWIDDSVVNNLIKMQEDMTEFSFTDTWVHFRGTSGIVFSAIRNQEASYPDKKLKEYSDLFEKQDTDIENALPKDFAKIMDRVGILSSEKDGFYTVELQIKKDVLNVAAKNDAGKIKEKTKWQVPFEKEIEVKFLSDFNFLKEAFSKVPVFFIRQSDDSVDLVFYNESFKQIVRGISI